MSEYVAELNKKNFDDFIAKGKCVVDFWAEWCGPCKAFKPVFEETAKEMKKKLKFGKVNIENNDGLAKRLNIMSIPTIILFKNKEEADRITGFMTKDELKEIISASF